MGLTPEDIRQNAIDKAATDAAAKAAADAAAQANAKAAADAAAAAAKAKQDLANSGMAAAASFGISEALLAAHPELVAVYNMFKAGDTAGATEALYRTAYYRDSSSTVKTREKQKLEQPAVYADSLEKYKIAARQRLVTTGIKIDTAAFELLAADAYAKGMDDNQFDQAIMVSGKITGFGGNILGDTTALKAYANSFGVDKYLDTNYWTQKQKDLFMGSVTSDDIQKEIRDKAASAFPGYTDQINNGITVDSIASAYKGAMANILERDADSITYDDPRLRAALQYVGPDGKPSTKPLWQFEKELRSSPEWQYTNNARNTVDSMSLKVLQDWGMM
jgi:hypothetical protein